MLRPRRISIHLKGYPMVGSTAASTHIMTTAFQKALKPLVEGYIQQIPSIDEKTQKMLTAFDAAIDAVGPDTPEGKNIAKQKAKLEPDIAKLRKQRTQEVSEALVMACNSLRLSVSLKKAKHSGASSNGSVQRLPKADLEEACKKILKTLPTKSGKFLNGAHVAEKLDLEPVVLRSALAKLKRDGLAVSNGKKGRAGGYRKA